MAYRNRNFDRNNYGGSISRNVDPWDTSNDWGMRGGGNNNMGGGGGGGGSHGGSGGGQGGGNYNQNELANHLLQLLRNNGGSQGGPPSLMDLPQGDMRGYGYGGARNNGGGGDFDRFEDRRMGGGGGGGHHNSNNRQNHNNHNNNNNNNNRNRRMGGGGAGNNGLGGPNPRQHPQQQLQQQNLPGKGPNQGGANNLNRNSGGIRKPNSLDRSKKVLAKHSKNNNSAKAAGGDAAAAKPKTTVAADHSFVDESEENENGANAAESLYADVPSDMFYCHLCKKHMWDCTSFENHVKGRTHQMMKEGVEESYRLKANMIRQEAKIDEQLKSIEVERLKRMGKQMKNSNAHREYCQMCDLHFYGHLSTHRKSEGHLSLKKFLHPKCSECNDEFQNRIEFDAHLLSREHMLKCAAKANRLDARKKNQLVILTELDEAKDVREEKVKAAAAAPDAPAEVKPEVVVNPDATEETGAAATENGEAPPATIAEGDEKGAAEAKPEVENPDAILDYVEGVTEIGTDVEAKIPTYNSARAIAPSMMAKLQCVECKLCNRFFDNEKTAEVHSRTVYHHKQFAKFLAEKSNEAKIALKRAAATIENDKRKRARLEKETADAGTAENGGGEGAAVVADAVEGGEPATAPVVKDEVAEEDNGEQPPKKVKVEMYDPCEATTDGDELDKDVSMAEVPATPVKAVAAPAVVATTPAPVASTPVANAVKATPVTPAAAATPSPAATPKSANSNTGTPGRGRGGNRGNARGRGRGGRRF